MTKVEVKDELIAEVRKLHKRYESLDDKHTVTTALEDYVELSKDLKLRGR